MKAFFHYFDFISKKKNKSLSIEFNNLSDSDSKFFLINSNIKTHLYHSKKMQYVSDKYSIIAKILAILTFV